MTPKQAAVKIWEEFLGRSGVGDELEACDDNIQEEIQLAILKRVTAAVEAEREACARMAMFNGSMPLAKAIRGRGAK